MRTTLEIDEDLLRYLKEQAEETGRSTGEIASDLMRQALDAPEKPRHHTEFPTFTRSPGSNVVVTMELVNTLRDESA